VENNGRRIIRNPLLLEKGRYRMDFKGLERAAGEEGARLLILCSPHNPVGRVWTAEELRRLGEICMEHNITVASDEIHGDLVLRGNTHVPYATLGDEFLKRSITCTAPSKTFNLPGLQTANVIIPDVNMRDTFIKALERNGIFEPNAFGPAALEAAYRHGEEWLEQLLAYIQGNLEELRRFIKERIPRIKVVEPEATYMVWLDCRGLGLDTKSLKQLIRCEAKVALNEGFIFGSPEGDGFERINIACPRSVLREGLVRIEKAVNSIGRA
jgi:cystathionine beta-lyase